MIVTAHFRKVPFSQVAKCLSIKNRAGMEKAGADAADLWEKQYWGKAIRVWDMPMAAIATDAACAGPFYEVVSDGPRADLAEPWKAPAPQCICAHMIELPRKEAQTCG